MDGNHFLSKTLKIDQTMNLPNNKILTIKADTGARPVINGGIEVKNWQPVTVNGNAVYKANVSGLKYGRNFYVNEEPMVLASTDQENRLAWTWTTQGIYDKINLTSYNLSNIVNVSQLEAVWHCEWKTFIKRAGSITGTNTINMRQPDFDWAITPATVGNIDNINPSMWNWFPDPRNPKFTLYLQNDVSLIDVPGEFCYNEAEKAIYYYPKHGEDPNTKECIVSKLDTVISMTGTPSNKLTNVTFDGVVIGYGGFDIIGEHGMATEQAQFYFAGPTTEAQSGEDNTLMTIPDNYYKGNVTVNMAKNINFKNCDIINTGKSIHFDEGVEGGSVVGCYFKDTGDSAVVVGNGWSAYAEGAFITSDITISNNVIRRIGQVHHSVPAISSYFSRRATITHNDIYDIPATGISVGWGWYVCLGSDYSQDNTIEYNKIGKYMQRIRDGGGIYTLGQSPNSTVKYNYMFDQKEAYAGLYHDEGSSGYTTEWNVVDNVEHRGTDTSFGWLDLNGRPIANGSDRMTVYDLIIRNNFTTNDRIVNRGDPYTVNLTPATIINADKAQWPQAAADIANGSGVEAQYNALLSK